MSKEKLMAAVDEICEEYGFVECPAYDLLEGMRRKEIIELLKQYNWYGEEI